ncbi:lysylphosphatidylglycerol synthase transmembrane domain-containing protein [Halomicrococcus sp. SG-WS-1]|uniref:lysylphosphatidylglycerol synthase transmembrane domain-containing protein n=1 Tax=Halomicrococcus sp. SG-WS-1 TaxID=3439057 RepID=UPI003F7AF038
MRLDLGDVRTIVVGFVAAIVVLFAVAAVVGIDQVLGKLAMADTRLVALVGVVALAWLASWAMALRTVLSALGVSVSPVRAFMLYAGATFANNITPFGQAGGEPFSALLISRVTDAEYETGLAAIASVDSINFVPSISFGLVGVVYYATVLTIGDRLQIEFVALAVVSLALAVPISATLLWRSRDRVEAGVASAVVPVVGALARAVPRITPTTHDAVRRRVRGFFRAIERVASDRRSLLLALLFSALGWLLSATSLWLSLYALGVVVPFAAVLFVVPIVSMAGVTPLPGGLGGVEAALVFLLGPIAGISGAMAAAAAFIHRAATYWLPVAIGGVSTAMLEADNANGD